MSNTATEASRRNGVDVATLFATLDAVKSQPEIAKFQFRASNTWVSGTHSRSQLSDFYGAMQEMQHKHVTTLDAFAFAEMNLRDTGSLGRDHDQLRSWCWSNQAGCSDDATNRALLRGDGANRDDCFALHFFGR